MKLITKNEVSYNTGGVKGNSTGIVTMNIVGFNHVCKPNIGGNLHTIEVEYNYTSSTGDVITQGVFKLNSADEINGFHLQIASSLPVFTTKTKSFEDEVTIGAKMEFANTFGILPQDIK